MKMDSIKKHLKPYSIYEKRKTTINHAFASAIAPYDEFNPELIKQALEPFGLDPEKLECVYCGGPAQTWDHLVGLVQDSEFNGYGHQIGNLVPCCRECNSSKGSRDWKEFIKNLELQQKLETYLKTYATPIEMDEIRRLKDEDDEFKKDYDNFIKKRDEILKLMQEADEIAKRIRDKILKLIQLKRQKHNACTTSTTSD